VNWGENWFSVSSFTKLKNYINVEKLSGHCDFNVQKAGAAGLKYSMEYERVYSPTDGVISHYEGLHPVKVQDTQEKD
jgi:hypothetical protein